MNIGIDFDNTLVQYDTLFREIAYQEGLISRKRDITGKREIRDYLHRQTNGEESWMKLQGLVYGKHMHRAQLTPGVANFLLSCKGRNYRIFVVSHKTEHGHFDPAKILLRGEALQWMEVRRFFDPEYFGLDRADVFFADTREEKVNIITSLKCEWFIDDLPEIFDEKHFPASTHKILFGSYNPEEFQNRTALKSWRKISEKILGHSTDEDVLFWVKSIVGESIHCIERIPGQGNSNIYRIDFSGEKSYAIKYYPDQLNDNRPRLESEFQALQILHNSDIKNVPLPIEKNNDLNLGLYEWIESKKIINPTNDNLEQTIEFSESLYTLSKELDENLIDIASEACLSANELVNQIEKRLLRLKRAGKDIRELSFFLERVFEPLWEKVRDESFNLWPEASQRKNLLREKQTLSPSDFGFHNCLKVKDGLLIFLDFEYFGWDDPVKFTADFIWHPATNLDTELKNKWKTAMIELYSGDPYFVDRLNAAMPLYGLRWAMILLNEFLPELAYRRKDALGAKYYDLGNIQNIQLKKAQNYCEQVMNMCSPLTFA